MTVARPIGNGNGNGNGDGYGNGNGYGTISNGRTRRAVNSRGAL